jgi:hypothetical protein
MADNDWSDDERDAEDASTKRFYIDIDFAITNRCGVRLGHARAENRMASVQRWIS